MLEALAGVVWARPCAASKVVGRTGHDPDDHCPRAGAILDLRRLMQQRQASPHTQSTGLCATPSRQFLRFAQQRLDRSPSRLTFEQMRRQRADHRVPWRSSRPAAASSVRRAAPGAGGGAGQPRNHIPSFATRRFELSLTQRSTDRAVECVAIRRASGSHAQGDGRSLSRAARRSMRCYVRLSQKCPGAHGRDDAIDAFILTAVQTALALRLSEMTGLKRQDFDLRRPALTLRVSRQRAARSAARPWAKPTRASADGLAARAAAAASTTCSFPTLRGERLTCPWGAVQCRRSSTASRPQRDAPR